MSQKKKANAKKIGMSFAKMLHKKALRRAQKAKGMHKTDGRGRPRTVGVKRRGAGTSNAVGRPRNTPAISAGTGVADTSVTSDSQTKLEMDKFEQNEKNVEQSKPVVELTASTSASVVAGGAASNTDEESGPATRRSITSRTTPTGVEKKSTAAKSNHSSVTKKTSSQKRKATIKLKRRTTKSTSALRIVGTESGSTSAINDERAVGDRSGDVVVTSDGEPNEEMVLSDSESSRRKSTRSSTLATSSPAGSQLNASIKDEEDESANLATPTSKIADSAETVQEVKIEGDNSKEEEKASSNEERRMTRGRLQKELEGKEQNERRELSVDPKQIVEIKAEPKDASKELPSEQNPQKETVADRNVADVKTEPADQVETTKKVGGRGKRKSVIVKSDGGNNDEEESKKKRESAKLHARRASSSQQSMAAAAHEMNYMLPEDRNKAVSREERKLQQQIALMERLQAQAKRKENKKHHANEQSSHHHHQHQDNISTTNVTDGGASTVEIQDDETKSNTSGGNKRASRASVRRSSMNATAAAESKKARVSGGASSNNKRSSLSRESDDARLQESGMGDVKKEAKEEPMESECNAAAAVPTTAAKTTTVSSAVPTSTVHTPISPPPRKRWASALAKNETQSSHIDNATPKSGSNVVQQQPSTTSTQAKNASTPSPVSGKKAWLLQRAKQTHEESTKMESETPSISRTAGVSAKTVSLC
ncbi:unnamed protein product [Anisakis simplex]|uniref:HSF_DOMAIN domain-containing protein n=1 Tax=Anisakis simplex TaxID=6269 RepID=A0A0M3KC70_ANISI|nr:unnamed protein product [Anisakis simplex]